MMSPRLGPVRLVKAVTLVGPAGGIVTANWPAVNSAVLFVPSLVVAMAPTAVLPVDVKVLVGVFRATRLVSARELVKPNAIPMFGRLVLNAPFSLANAVPTDVVVKIAMAPEGVGAALVAFAATLVVGVAL